MIECSTTMDYMHTSLRAVDRLIQTTGTSLIDEHEHPRGQASNGLHMGQPASFSTARSPY